MPEDDGQATASAETVAKTPSVGDSAPAPGTLTQEQFDRALQARIAETERATRRKILDEVGVGTMDEAKSVLKAAKEAKDANRSELDKALAEARAEIEAARLERQSALMDRHALNVERALAVAGAHDNLADLAKLVNVEPGATAEEVAEAVEQTKLKFAPLFGRPSATPPSSEPSGGGPSLRPSTSPDAEARGRERAQQLNDRQRPRTSLI